MKLEIYLVQKLHCLDFYWFSTAFVLGMHVVVGYPKFYSISSSKIIS